jgi:2-C-methyl-D-erythritol 2,4-cyclodiphosphate synthase
VENRELILGGVKIPYEKGLLGHSDADVLTHAIMDAILGAAALGDIGKHFPDTDVTYKGASSIKLLIHVNELIREKGFIINNIDATVVCEQPKLKTFIPEMIKIIAQALDINQDTVNVKATTTEGLGFEGEGKGISAQAIASLKF